MAQTQAGERKREGGAEGWNAKVARGRSLFQVVWALFSPVRTPITTTKCVKDYSTYVLIWPEPSLFPQTILLNTQPVSESCTVQCSRRHKQRGITSLNTCKTNRTAHTNLAEQSTRTARIELGSKDPQGKYTPRITYLFMPHSTKIGHSELLLG